MRSVLAWGILVALVLAEFARAGGARPQPLTKPELVKGTCDSARLLNALATQDPKLFELLGSTFDITDLYEAPNTHNEGTIASHSAQVLNTFEAQKHLYREVGHEARFKEAQIRDELVLRAAIALHDIGKPISRKNQHAESEPIIRHVLHELGFSEKEVQFAVAVVGADPLGVLIKHPTHENQENSAAYFENHGREIGLLASEVYGSLRPFYNADVYSYSNLRGRVFSKVQDIATERIEPRSKSARELLRSLEHRLGYHNTLVQQSRSVGRRPAETDEQPDAPLCFTDAGGNAFHIPIVFPRRPWEASKVAFYRNPRGPESDAPPCVTPHERNITQSKYPLSYKLDYKGDVFVPPTDAMWNYYEQRQVDRFVFDSRNPDIKDLVIFGTKDDRYVALQSELGTLSRKDIKYPPEDKKAIEKRLKALNPLRGLHLAFPSFFDYHHVARKKEIAEESGTRIEHAPKVLLINRYIKTKEEFFRAYTSGARGTFRNNLGKPDLYPRDHSFLDARRPAKPDFITDHEIYRMFTSPNCPKILETAVFADDKTQLMRR